MQERQNGTAGHSGKSFPSGMFSRCAIMSPFRAVGKDSHARAERLALLCCYPLSKEVPSRRSFPLGRTARKRGETWSGLRKGSPARSQNVRKLSALLEFLLGFD